MTHGQVYYLSIRRVNLLICEKGGEQTLSNWELLPENQNLLSVKQSAWHLSVELKSSVFSWT